MNRWWDGSPNEKYWLEITDRADLGVDLNAPQTDGSGKEYWSYSLIHELRPGDIVFHYWKPAAAIVAWSRVVGGSWADEIVWAAHGTVAREAGVEPFRRPGWRLGLADFAPLVEPVTLSELRRAEGFVRRVASSLTTSFGKSIYFPLAVSDRRPVRPAQGYLTKWPADLLVAFPALADAAMQAEVTAPVVGGDDAPRRGVEPPGDGARVGAEYRPANLEAATSRRDPFSIDPAIVERGLRGHAMAQEALAEFLRRNGHLPRSPRPDEPNYDLAWEQDDRTYVVEVKSLTDRNEEKQLRLGLGQVLRYRHLLAESGRDVRAVLMAERRPADLTWHGLCIELDVELVWPERLHSGDVNFAHGLRAQSVAP